MARDDSTPRPDPLDTSLLFEVFALNQAVGRFLAEAMSEGPLTPAEYAVHSALFELESATPTALATRLGMRLTTFMDQLRAMESRGHARRMPNPRDGRSQLVTLTAAGLEAHRASNRLFEAACETFITELGGETTFAWHALVAMRRAAEGALAVSPRRSGGRAG